MKRKFKLITSIASLTAAVALLAVGAFAAGSRTVDVSGTVWFSASNVDATIEVFQGWGEPPTQEVVFDEEPSHTVVFSAEHGGTQDGSVRLGGDNGEIVLDDDIYVYAFQIVVTNTFQNGHEIEVVWEWSGESVSDLEEIGVTIELPGENDRTKFISMEKAATFTVTVTIANPSLVPADLLDGIQLRASVTLSIYHGGEG